MRINRYALTEIRQRSGLSKSQLASRAGKATSTISDLESGRRDASEELLSSLAIALACPVVALMALPEGATA